MLGFKNHITGNKDFFLCDLGKLIFLLVVNLETWSMAIYPVDQV